MSNKKGPQTPQTRHRPPTPSSDSSLSTIFSSASISSANSPPKIGEFKLILTVEYEPKEYVQLYVPLDPSRRAHKSILWLIADGPFYLNDEPKTHFCVLCFHLKSSSACFIKNPDRAGGTLPNHAKLHEDISTDGFVLSKFIDLDLGRLRVFSTSTELTVDGAVQRKATTKAEATRLVTDFIKSEASPSIASRPRFRAMLERFMAVKDASYARISPRTVSKLIKEDCDNDLKALGAELRGMRPGQKFFAALDGWDNSPWKFMCIVASWIKVHPGDRVQLQTRPIEFARLTADWKTGTVQSTP